VKKNRLNWLKFWKNRKNRTNPNRKKPRQTGKNRAKPVWTGFVLKNQTENRSVWTGFGFFKKNRFGYLFLIKTEPNRKWSPLIYTIFATVNGIIITWLKTFYLYDMKIIIWTWIIKIDYKIIRNLKLIIKTRKLMNNIKFINSNCWVKKNCHFVFKHKNIFNYLVFNTLNS